MSKMKGVKLMSEINHLYQTKQITDETKKYCAACIKNYISTGNIQIIEDMIEDMSVIGSRKNICKALYEKLN